MIKSNTLAAELGAAATLAVIWWAMVGLLTILKWVWS